MKGMSITLRLIIVAMILVSIAFILLKIASGGLTNFFGFASEQQQSSAEETSKTMLSAVCKIKLTSACNGDQEKPADWDEACNVPWPGCS